MYSVFVPSIVSSHPTPPLGGSSGRQIYLTVAKDMPPFPFPPFGWDLFQGARDPPTRLPRSRNQSACRALETRDLEGQHHGRPQVWGGVGCSWSLETTRPVLLWLPEMHFGTACWLRQPQSTGGSDISPQLLTRGWGQSPHSCSQDSASETQLIPTSQQAPSSANDLPLLQLLSYPQH